MTAQTSAAAPRQKMRVDDPGAALRANPAKIAIGIIGMVGIVWGLANLFLAFGYYPQWFGNKFIIGVLAIIVGVGGAALLFYFLNMFVEGLPRRLSEGAIPYAFVLPGLFFVALMLIYPTFQSINYSFANADSTAYVGLQNYRTIFADPRVLAVDRQQRPVAAHRPSHRRRVRCHGRRARRQAVGDRREGRQEPHLPPDGDLVRRRLGDLGPRLRLQQPRPGPDRSAQRHLGGARRRAADVAADLHREAQLDPAHGHPDLAAGRLLDGAAQLRDQGRPRGHHRGRPHRRCERAADLLQGRSSRRSAARSSRSS